MRVKIIWEIEQPFGTRCILIDNALSESDITAYVEEYITDEVIREIIPSIS
jgi:hypothetical protein